MAVRALSPCRALTTPAAQGLNWVALTPRTPVSVELEGEPVLYLHPSLTPAAATELRWLWDALQAATRTASLLVLYRGQVVLQAGLAPPGGAACREPAAAAAALDGPIVATARSSGTANYFANLALYPGRFEFAGLLPSNTQALLVQPLGGEGALLAGCGTQRGFGTRDQRYVSLIAQKLDSSLDATFFRG